MADTSPVTYELFGTLPAQIAARIGRPSSTASSSPARSCGRPISPSSFGVSRASVREALRMVESEGLVTILPQRGAQVTVLSAQELQDVFEIRANLMGLACARLAASASPEVHAQLSDLLKNLKAAREDGDAYARASAALSDYCVRSAGSKRLADLILSFGRQTARYAKLSMATPERRRQSLGRWRDTRCGHRQRRRAGSRTAGAAVGAGNP